MDEAQTKFIYKISAGEDGLALYDDVQKAIDQAKKKADYVVALGHLGDDPASGPWTSVEVIAHTHGLDAFIDGHSHSTVEYRVVQDKDGHDVVLSQTGSYFAAIGCMTLSDSGISSKLIKSYERSDETVSKLVTDWVATVDAKLGEEIAVLDASLYINDPENPKARLVRKQETNMGDLVADAAYWYFNEKEGLKCDIAIGNGGGIRTDIPAGAYSYKSAKTVQPFGNVVCLVELTGKEVREALEFGARKVGSGENGGFLHVAGVTYTIDTSVPDTVKTNEKGMWVASPEAYRVTDIKIYNKETGTYEPIDMEKTYTMGGVNYTLRHMGDGFSMLSNTKLVKDYVGEDYLVTSAYVKAFAKGEDGKPHISTANSPLKSYKNYLLDYENPNGSGRITIK
jgi:2',3'-cyclic-nucleotide 2'-phosphodiesterase (5'-nucleotidase family)